MRASRTIGADDREGEGDIGRAAVRIDEQVEGCGDGRDGDDRTRETAGGDQRERPDHRDRDRERGVAEAQVPETGQEDRRRHLYRERHEDRNP